MCSAFLSFLYKYSVFMAAVEENLFEKSQLVLSAEHTNNVVLLVQNLSILSVL